MAQFLASRGYLVIEPEFRGSTGYGEAHFTAGWKQWGQAMQDDVADALLWARKQGLANDKACVAGASYGGYSTLMGLVKHPELYRCGVAWLAVADLDLFIQGSWLVDDDVSDVARKFSLPDLIGDPVKDAAMIAANSPFKAGARIKAPLLLAYGERSARAPGPRHAAARRAEGRRQSARVGGLRPRGARFHQAGEPARLREAPGSLPGQAPGQTLSAQACTALARLARLALVLAGCASALASAAPAAG